MTKSRPRVLKKIKFNVSVFNVLESTIPKIEGAIREAIAAETSMAQTEAEQVRHSDRHFRTRA